MIWETIEAEDGKELILRRATPKDMDDLKSLYYRVYGGKYTLPEINDTDKMKWLLHDPNYLWLIIEDKGFIVASLIFVISPQQRLGKTFAAVVHNDYRGKHIMMQATKRGIDYLFNESDSCDIIYATVRTFASMGLHNMMKAIGFHDLGIFPNVRKISRYETHGLKVLFKDGTLEKRKKQPRLVPQTYDIFHIAQKQLKLEGAVIEDVEVPNYQKNYILPMYIEKSPEIEWEYYRMRDSGELKLCFYPLYYPHLKLYTKDHRTEVFLLFEERDGHGAILGIKTDITDMIMLLKSIANYAESLGLKYLEFLVSAFKPRLQREAYEASFFPSAYFPALSLNEENERHDFFVCCRTFVPYNFEGLNLTDDAKPYALAFVKTYTNKMLDDLEAIKKD